MSLVKSAAVLFVVGGVMLSLRAQDDALLSYIGERSFCETLNAPP